MEMQDKFTDEIIHKRLADNFSLLKIYAFKLTGDKCRADDLLQETIVKVLYNAAAFVYNGNFKGWATTIMYNIFLNERLRFSRSTSVADDSFFDGEYFDCYIGAREILRVINSLPSEYRLVFLMYADGYKYHEIAEELYIPIGTVKSRIHTARIRLQLLLKDYIG